MRKQSKGILKKCMVMVLSASLLITVLSGCMGLGAPEEEEERVLRIGVINGGYNGFDNIRSQFTDIWDYTHPKVELEFVAAIDRNQMRYSMPRPEPGTEEEQPTPEEQLQALMEGDNPPDLVFFEQQQLDHLMQENLLAPLEPLMTESEFDTSDFAPAVEETLREAGSGQLFALAPTFTSSALLYNRGLFIEKGVELPRDGMSWDDMFDLARRISGGEGEEQIFGFNFDPNYNNNIFRNLRMYTAPLDLRMIDEDTEEVLVNSEGWANVWNKFLDLQQAGIFPGELDYQNISEEDRRNNPFLHDAFMSNKLAMTIVQYSRLDQVISANRSADTIEGFDYIDWDVVTMPTHHESPGEGGILNMSPIMGINAKAQNSEDAWELLSFIMGEEWADMKGRSSRQLMTRTSHIEPKDNLEFNIDAFTQLKPTKDANPNRYNANMRYYYEIEHLGRRKFQEVVNDQKTVSEALQEWETEAKMTIERHKERMDSNSDMSQEKINLMRASGEL